jgi:hypothetical protein
VDEGRKEWRRRGVWASAGAVSRNVAKATEKFKLGHASGVEEGGKLGSGRVLAVAKKNKNEKKKWGNWGSCRKIYERV